MTTQHNVILFFRITVEPHHRQSSSSQLPSSSTIKRKGRSTNYQ